MKILFVFAFVCLCAPLATFGQWQYQELPRRTCSECVIVRGYDPAKNRTRLSLKMLPVADVPDGKMYLTLSRNIVEDTAGGPDKIAYAGITFIAKTTVEVKDTEVLMIADGKPISLGRAPLGGTLTTSSNKKVSNYLSVANWESVSKLGLADKLELRFGGMEIKLSDEHRAAIRDFLFYAAGGH